MPETEMERASVVAEKLRASVEAHVFTQGNITISIGVAHQPPRSGVTGDTLIASSGQALKEAKSHGGNQVTAVE